VRGLLATEWEKIPVSLLLLRTDVMSYDFAADYFFNGHRRLELWFANPNQCGALFALVLPAIWLSEWLTRVKRRGFLGMGLLVIECTIWLLLMETYSRGALVSAVLALVTWESVGRCRGLIVGQRAIGIGRIGFALVSTVTCGFLQRMELSYLRNDRAVQNREAMWAGGIAMIHENPISGWGPGNSGNIYSNWYEPLGHHEWTESLVNSYLTVASERGLVVFAGICYLMAFVLGRTVVCLWLLKKHAIGSLWALCTINGWLLLNMFSDLYYATFLWALPLAASIYIYSTYRPIDRFTLQIAMWSFAFAILLPVLIYLTGGLLGHWIEVPVKRTGEHGVIVGGGKWRPPTVIVIDNAVLGRWPGRPIREWVMSYKGHGSVAIVDQSGAQQHCIKAETQCVVLCGKAANWRVDDGLTLTKEIVVNPSEAPSLRTELQLRKKSLDRCALVVLSELIDAEVFSKWRLMTEKFGIDLVVLKERNADLEDDWPAVARLATITP